MYKLLAFATAASALVAPSAPKASSALKAAELPEGASAPFGFWDPAGLSNYGSERTQAWFKAAELKHSRVAMLASAGWIVNGLHLAFPGSLATGVKFEDLAAKSPLEAWEATPFDGKVQILIAIGLAEFHSEFGAPYKTHYTKGGPLPGNQLNFLGDSKWEDVWGGKVISTTSAKTDEQFLNQQNAELNNGRLAMIGIMGFSAAALIPEIGRASCRERV